MRVRMRVAKSRALTSARAELRFGAPQLSVELIISRSYKTYPRISNVFFARSSGRTSLIQPHLLLVHLLLNRLP